MTDFNKLFTEVAGNAGPLCILLTIFFVNVLILGIALRTACSLFNMLTGGRDSAEAVPMPSMVGSMVMVVITHLVTAALAVALIWGFAALAASIHLSPQEAAYYGYMASIPLSFLVLTVLLALFLPAPIFRAFLISLLYLLCAIVTFILFTAICWVIFVALGLSMPGLQKLPWVQ